MSELPVTWKVGGEQIVGMLHTPDHVTGRKWPAVVFLHGFTGNKPESHRLFVLTARQLAQAGIGALRFDFRGSGDSAGDFSEMTISRELEDARAAVAFIRGQPNVDTQRVGLIGMSMGGMVSALLLGEDAGIPAAVLWCPVADFHRLWSSRMNDKVSADLSSTGIADYGGWPVGKNFIEDGMKHDPVKSLARSKAEILVLHGDGDDAVPVQESAMYRNVTRREIIPGADHTFNSLAWVKQVTELSATWFVRRWT